MVGIGEEERHWFGDSPGGLRAKGWVQTLLTGGKGNPLTASWSLIALETTPVWASQKLAFSPCSGARWGQGKQRMGGVETVGEGEESLRGLVREGYLRCCQSPWRLLSRAESWFKLLLPINSACIAFVCRMNWNKKRWELRKKFKGSWSHSSKP